MPLDFLFPDDVELQERIEDGILHDPDKKIPVDEPEQIPIKSNGLNKHGDGRGMHNGKRGRRKGARNLNRFERVEIGVAAHFQTAEQVAAEHGVNPMQVHLAKNGKTSVNNYDPSLYEEIKQNVDVHLTKFEGRRSKILNETSKRLLEVMGILTKDKIVSDAKEARLIAGIAKDIAIVQEKTEKKAGAVRQKNFVFQVFAPNEMDEAEFGEPINIESKVVE